MQPNTGTPPWGISRMRPYPSQPAPGFASVEVDPATQLAAYRDVTGQVVEAGKHGTGTANSTSKANSTNSDGKGDTDSDQSSDRD